MFDARHVIDYLIPLIRVIVHGENRIFDSNDNQIIVQSMRIILNQTLINWSIPLRRRTSQLDRAIHSPEQDDTRYPDPSIRCLDFSNERSHRYI